MTHPGALPWMMMQMSQMIQTSRRPGFRGQRVVQKHQESDDQQAAEEFYLVGLGAKAHLHTVGPSSRTNVFSLMLIARLPVPVIGAADIESMIRKRPDLSSRFTNCSRSPYVPS